MWFLVHYNPANGRLIELREYSDDRVEVAQKERLELELQLQRETGRDHEVVLLSADDEAALRQTHRRYFETTAQILRSR